MKVNELMTWGVVVVLLLVQLVSCEQLYEYKTVNSTPERVGRYIANMAEDGWKLKDKTEAKRGEGIFGGGPFRDRSKDTVTYYVLTFRRLKRLRGSD